jgi:hypothetical protein
MSAVLILCQNVFVTEILASSSIYLGGYKLDNRGSVVRLSGAGGEGGEAARA